MIIIKEKNFLIILFSVIIFGILSLPNCSEAADFYIAQTAAGGDTGADCANAHSATWFNTAGNWANPKQSGKAGPGDTVHLCGTFTAAYNTNLLTVQASGSSGFPITIRWEAGALLTSPSFCTQRAVNINSKSYIVLDGNGTNPSITATVAGSQLTYQCGGEGVGSDGVCDGCEIKNLKITNMYVRTLNTDKPSNGGAGINMLACGSSISIHDNVIDHAHTGIRCNSWVNGASNVQIYNNTTSHHNWQIDVRASNANTISNIYVHHNTLGNMDNWDEPATNAYHHDGVFVVQDGAGAINNTYIYDNLFNGAFGTYTTAWIYTNTNINGMYVYNNVFLTASGTGYAIEGGGTGDQNYYTFNNYISCNGSGGIYYGSSSSITNVTIKNNAMTGCDSFLYACSHVPTGTVIVDYNRYADNRGGTNAFWWNGVCGGQDFSHYQSVTGLDQHSTMGTSLSADSTGHPLPGSALIGAATNLTSLNISPLNLDKAGIPRPSIGVWDTGAYNSGASIVRPNPPVLMLIQ